MTDTKGVNQIYVAVDCGKSDTKLVSYNVTGNKKLKQNSVLKFRQVHLTMICMGEELSLLRSMMGQYIK